MTPTIRVGLLNGRVSAKIFFQTWPPLAARPVFVSSLPTGATRDQRETNERPTRDQRETKGRQAKGARFLKERKREEKKLLFFQKCEILVSVGRSSPKLSGSYAAWKVVGLSLVSRRSLVGLSLVSRWSLVQNGSTTGDTRETHGKCTGDGSLSKPRWTLKLPQGWIFCFR